MSEASLLQVLDVLADGALHSGEALAQRFGISRAALGKRMDHLRDWGLELNAQAGAGYRLAAPLERLDAGRIRAALPAAMRGVHIAVLTQTDSTNTQLLSTDAAADPQVLFAERQTAGRGRRGRHWVSPFGANVYASVAFTFECWPARLTTLPLAIAVALARVVAAAGVPDVGIKWPNDLHVAGRKLAGILIEPRGEAGGPCRVVVGVGLNLSMSTMQAEGLSQPWISLAEALTVGGKPMPSRNTLASMLVEELMRALHAFAHHGFSPFVAEWRQRDLLAGRPVQVDGAQPLQGMAQGIDADGGLIINTSVGRQIVHAGDVSVRAA